MLKIFQPIFFLLCFCLYFVGCDGQGKEAKEPSAFNQISDPAGLIKHAIRKQETGAYDEAIDILSHVLEVQPRYAQMDLKIKWLAS